jgi:hypothetical protein
MSNSRILARVKDDLRKGIEVVIGVRSYFYSGDIEYELRKIVERYPQLSVILSPIITDANNGYGCGGDVYFVMRNDIVSVRIKFIKPEVRFDIDIAMFDLFCDTMIDVGIFMTDGGVTGLTEL